jgi:poly-gamma-glutamate capsule biosynthesis protein CapA/YwtB (metallophosphatase superfamily)
MADVRVAFIGDTYIQRPDPWAAFAPNMPFFDEPDIFFCNLETVVADAKYLPAYDPMARFPRTDESVFKHYLAAGINVLNIANNPGMYHGRDCYVRMLDVLDESGVVYGGGGRNLAEARKPAYIEKNGTRVAFVFRASVLPPEAAATADRPGMAAFKIHTAYEPVARLQEVPGSPPIIRTFANKNDQSGLEEDIAEARRNADVVIVSWHWGISPASGGTGQLAEYQSAMGHFAIDAGADMVFGHHPHVLQPIEVYKGKVIAYSIGNYVHDMDHFGVQKFDAMLLRCLIRDKRIAEVSFVPGRIDGHGPPVYGRPSAVADVVARMESMSASFGTKFETNDESVVVCPDV